MSQNNLNKSNTLSSKNSQNDKKNNVKPKETNSFYNFLKPIVHDYTKLCKKGKIKNSEKEKKSEPDVKIIFEKSKRLNLDNFIKTNVDKKFKCQLCENLFKMPVECYKCLNLFCDQCMMKKLEEFKKCPKCFNIVFRDMMRSVDMEQMESYKQAKVKCPFVGCKENLRLKEIEEHLASCIFQDMTEEKKKNLNKIIYKNDADDPLMKTYMLDYLKEVNKNLGKLTTNYQKDEKYCTLEDLGFFSRLGKFQDQLSNLNDHAARTMGEMTRITKITNSNLKNLINN